MKKADKFVLRGKLVKLFACRDEEVLFDGPRGTGKSYPMSRYCVLYALANPGTRVAIGRKTRKSMTETTLVTLERVLRELHPESLTGCSRGHVQSYRVGASEIVIFGCDDENKLRGLEAAVIWIDECNEITVNEWESLQGALRWPIGKWRIIIGTCNPDSDQHWLWRRFRDGRIRRIQSSHLDNPSVTPEYLKRLERLTGIRRKRFFEGIWTAAEGQVLENWDEERNVIDCPLKKDGTPDYDALSISWYFGAMDWGHSAAGCLGIWGVDVAGRLIEVAEIYQSKRTTSWWCKQLVELNDRFPLRAIVADPSRPDMIADFNTALGYVPDAPNAICFGANNKRASANDLSGINLLIDLIGPADDGKPRMMFLRDNLVLGVDQELRDAGLPCCTIEEVAGWVWAKTKEGLYLKDKTDEKCADHGLDQARYAAMFARHYDMSDPIPLYERDAPDTYGALYGHSKMVTAMRMAEESGVTLDEILEEMAD